MLLNFDGLGAWKWPLAGFTLLVALFLLLLVWLLPKLWRFLRTAIGRIAAFFRSGGEPRV